MKTVYYGVLRASDRCESEPKIVGKICSCIFDAVTELRREFRTCLSESPGTYKYMYLSGDGMYAKVIHEKWNGYMVEWRVVELNAVQSCDDVSKQELDC